MLVSFAVATKLGRQLVQEFLGQPKIDPGHSAETAVIADGVVHVWQSETADGGGGGGQTQIFFFIFVCGH